MRGDDGQSQPDASDPNQVTVEVAADGGISQVVTQDESGGRGDADDNKPSTGSEIDADRDKDTGRSAKTLEQKATDE